MTCDTNDSSKVAFAVKSSGRVPRRHFTDNPVFRARLTAPTSQRLSILLSYGLIENVLWAEATSLPERSCTKTLIRMSQGQRGATSSGGNAAITSVRSKPLIDMDLDSPGRNE
jgi:hypothetical protein